jgi:hypothetical protein
MKKLVESGGGLLVMQEEFKNNIFRDSFQKVKILDNTAVRCRRG